MSFSSTTKHPTAIISDTTSKARAVGGGVAVVVDFQSGASSHVIVPSINDSGVMPTADINPPGGGAGPMMMLELNPQPLPPAPDPAAAAALPKSFRGHGTFIYELKETMAHHGGLAKMVKAMTDCGMTHAWLRVHGRSSPSGVQADNKKAVKALQDAGISVAAWGWCQGEDVAREARLAVQTTTDLGLSDYVADIEQEVNASDWTEAEVHDFLSAVRAGLPSGGGVAVSSFPLIDWHEPRLMRAASPLVDAFAPQVYWFFYPDKKMRREFGSRYAPESPAAYADLCLDRWREITHKPLILTGQTYWDEGGPHWDESETEIKLDAFLNDFQGWSRVTGVNWWHFGGSKAMTDKMLLSLQSAHAAGKFPPA